ncbi:MAG: DUF4124 domain-containing protein [Archangium sp.]
MTPLSLALLIASAQIYTWTDKEGVEHFTDNKSEIPKGVKVRVTEGDELSVISVDKKPAPNAASSTKPSNVIELQGAPQVVTLVTKSDDPNVPSAAEDYWRKLFRDARERVATLQDEIEVDRKRTEEVNGMPVRAGFICQQYGVPPVVFAPVGGTTTTVSVGAGGQIAPGVTVSGSATSVGVVRTFPSYPTSYVTPCGYGYNPEYAVARDRLEKNRRELVRAQEALADLERRASFEAVPLHWRR